MNIKDMFEKAAGKKLQAKTDELSIAHDLVFNALVDYFQILKDSHSGRYPDAVIIRVAEGSGHLQALDHPTPNPRPRCSGLSSQA